MAVRNLLYIKYTKRIYELFKLNIYNMKLETAMYKRIKQ